MNTFKSVLSIIFAIGMVFTIPIIQASETAIALTPESDTLLSNFHTAQHLLVDTPSLGTRTANWNIYLASINWADYDTEQDSETVRQLLLDTPSLGTKTPNWNIYLASINWADYSSLSSSLSDQ